MIDINDPKSKYIFDAAVCIDRIKGYCQLYIIENFDDRKETFQKMKQECEKLRRLSEIHFSENYVSINIVLVKLISEINRLETINNSTIEGNCTVCNRKLETFDPRIKGVGMITVCHNCPSKIYNYTNELELYTGVAFI